ncbi:hypothetical protein IQ235_09850 [Oscillatoriales cyanobacterium LEGE 11467]|uniref:Uncharacterized protein n=1 Tax=Zarconia navalis LEGE 11467 TaxID=1828826 RepID=A0A928Z805_9CYAN|nr:GrpB family protein [Zarconia navalis]MBE9041080.1 hypothetical protein [Zarconia navalis LEGE 11467]
MNSRQIDRHLIFRDDMWIYPEDTREYLQNVEGYMHDKDDLIKDTDKKAAA